MTKRYDIIIILSEQKDR